MFLHAVQYSFFCLHTEDRDLNFEAQVGLSTEAADKRQGRGEKKPRLDPEQRNLEERLWWETVLVSS